MTLVPPVNRSFMDRTERFSQGAINARSAMRTTQAPPPKTVGGAIGSAAGMGMAGYMMAGAVKGGIGGPTGAAIGAAIGLGAYLLS